MRGVRKTKSLFIFPLQERTTFQKFYLYHDKGKVAASTYICGLSASEDAKQAMAMQPMQPEAWQFSYTNYHLFNN